MTHALEELARALRESAQEIVAALHQLTAAVERSGK
jgi:hypothetical protein